MESSLARATLSGLDSQIDSVYSCATFVGADLYMSCVETETHSPCKNHLQKSFSVINSNGMQESWQTHQADPRGVLDLIDVEVWYFLFNTLQVIANNCKFCGLCISMMSVC